MHLRPVRVRAIGERCDDLRLVLAEPHLPSGESIRRASGPYRPGWRKGQSEPVSAGGLDDGESRQISTSISSAALRRSNLPKVLTFFC